MKLYSKHSNTQQRNRNRNCARAVVTNQKIGAVFLILSNENNLRALRAVAAECPWLYRNVLEVPTDVMMFSCWIETNATWTAAIVICRQRQDTYLAVGTPCSVGNKLAAGEITVFLPVQIKTVAAIFIPSTTLYTRTINSVVSHSLWKAVAWPIETASFALLKVGDHS